MVLAWCHLACVTVCLMGLHVPSVSAVEGPVKYGPRGTVGIPKKSFYPLLFLAENRTDASTHYRQFLVLSQEDSIEDVEKQVLATKPILIGAPRIWMPEWPKGVAFVKQVEAAIDAQEAVLTDRLTALQRVWKNHRGRCHHESTNSEDVHLAASFSGWAEQLCLHVKIKSFLTECREEIAVTLHGASRRLGVIRAVECCGREITIQFYDNGVPFILHSSNSDGLFGLQIRWLPDGKVARAICLKETWSVPRPKDSFTPQVNTARPYNDNDPQHSGNAGRENCLTEDVRESRK